MTVLQVFQTGRLNLHHAAGDCRIKVMGDKAKMQVYRLVPYHVSKETLERNNLVQLIIVLYVEKLTSYLEIEKNLQKVIYHAYGLSDLTFDELHLIKEIDDAMFCYEMKSLLNTHMENRTQLVSEYNLSFRVMHEVEEEFIKCVEKLLQDMLVIQ